jgi:hypothetical protein
MSDTNNKPRILPDLIAPKGTPTPKTDAVLAGTYTPEKSPETDTSKPAPVMRSFNGQKERTAEDERAAHVRRARRWHKKAAIALGLDGARALLTEALTWSQADTADAK